MNQMINIGEVSGIDYTLDQIFDIIRAHVQWNSSRKIMSYYILFLDGYFKQNGERQHKVLGISISNTNVIAIFKPLIAGTKQPKRAEQATLVHEFGHAIGLVNNGIEPVSNHHDEELGAHCTNRDCVMYYINENASRVGGFISDHIEGADDNLFGQECLEDVSYAAETANRR